MPEHLGEVLAKFGDIPTERSGTAQVCGTALGSTVELFLNNNADFVSQIVEVEAAEPLDVEAADVDGDQDVDVLVASVGDATVSWYMRRADIPLTNRGDAAAATRIFL